MSILVIPIDVSQVPDSDRKQQRVKVAVQIGDKVTSQVVPVDAGKAEVKLEVDPKQTLAIAVGPENVSDQEIFHFETLNARVTPNQWGDKAALTLAPITVTPIWWGLWLRWCRTFVIQGRVMCPSGPVPGAEVKAFDVDFFWWWSSASQVGPTVITDANGHFVIKFRWCCGWWPWWWWRLRRWRLEPILIDKIQPILKLNPQLKFAEPSPVPWFDPAALNPQPLPPRTGVGTLTAPVTVAPVFPIPRTVDPGSIPLIRDRLISLLPHVPDLERLRIWPWFPWTPWLDCSPDIIFRVTQNCGGGQDRVIVNENIFQARWDIPTNLNVNLNANSEACCIPTHDPDPQGNCALITGVCGDPGIISGNIGGNSAHPAGPDGYANPGTSDNPFAEAVTIWGQLGVVPLPQQSQSDYYEIEFREHPSLANPNPPWASVPAAALSGFTRGYFDSTIPWPNQWFYPSFPLKPLGTKQVYESRHHYEATHPANWGSVAAGRSWFLNVNELASVQTFTNFADGAYDFRVKGYKSLPNGEPDPNDPGVVLAGCGNHQENNLLVLRIDNRIVGPQQPGTVHINTTEPDCGINFVKIGNNFVQPCGAEHLLPHPPNPPVPLEIDFFCSDPDGHLDHYDLRILWGLGNVRSLFSFGAAPTGVGAVQPGPSYAQALTQPGAAPRPIWRGGHMKLIIPDASQVFPITCCYLIELTVWKRNIVNCGSSSYYNQMHHSFTVTVGP
jgi:hypothetical protein